MELGLPVAKVVQVLALMGLKVTTGAVHQALARLAKAADPTCRALVGAIRASAAVSADETGWRVGGWRRWLWVFVGDGVTVYLIAEGRGYEQAAEVLGENFSGVLERDGWAPYRRFEHATHQTCVAHLLRRCSELIAESVAGQAKVPHAVRRLLQDALALRDQHPDPLARHRDDEDVIAGTAVEITADDKPAPASPRGRGLISRLAGLARLALPAVTGARQPAAEPASPQSLEDDRAELHARLEKLLAGHPTHEPTASCLRIWPPSASTC